MIPMTRDRTAEDNENRNGFEPGLQDTSFFIRRGSVFDWTSYILKGYSFVEFASGTLVVDLGCGEGLQLQELQRRGCLAIGIDVERPSLEKCRSQGLRALQACAEQMPVKKATVEGLVCKSVIPLTDEPRAFREIGRVLKPGAIGYCVYIGLGYYLRYLLFGPSWKFRVYGLRTLVNTWLYAVTGRRLPGFFGDTIFQFRRQLAKYYRENGLSLAQEYPAKTFLGFPVFIYHTIQKVSD
jgi:SAM-dependent methyltransferase